jgi:hypothetical protein
LTTKIQIAPQEFAMELPLILPIALPILQTAMPLSTFTAMIAQDARA